MGAVTKAIDTVFSAVDDAVGTVVGAAEDVLKTVDKEIIQPVVKVVDNTIKAAEQDPIGTLAKVATAIYAPALLPAVNFANNVAQGQSFESALVNTGVSYITGQAGQNIGSSLN
jgi:transcription antitermination factor NusA-like protein